MSHPPIRELCKKAIDALKERNGSSRQAIKKWIMENYGDSFSLTTFDKTVTSCLKRGVEAGVFVQVKQSFKNAKSAAKKTKRSRSTSKSAAPKKNKKKKAKSAAPAKKSKSPKKKSALKKKAISKKKAKAKKES